ncbi:hypothetical protein PT974_09629 [Cladobotryum mycophilum]|uniref:Uncharacterized protein n=1 Tax=Cladobotryum mycophilum TaxID=491253 RepID=A0ABR0SGP1_9HYPO
MKFIILLTTLATTVLSAPTQSAQNLNAINPQSKFSCPNNVLDFCSASNVHSGCTFGGDFTSGNMDVCSSCHC